MYKHKNLFIKFMQCVYLYKRFKLQYRKGFNQVTRPFSMYFPYSYGEVWIIFVFSGLLAGIWPCGIIIMVDELFKPKVNLKSMVACIDLFTVITPLSTASIGKDYYACKQNKIFSLITGKSWYYYWACFISGPASLIQCWLDEIKV